MSNKLNKKFILLFFFSNNLAMVPDPCGESCNSDPLKQFYANQNQCALDAEIPVDLHSFGFGVYPPDCKNYNTYRFSYNKRFNIFPHAIFVPAGETELQEVFLALKANKQPFSIRSGGHCAEPGSLSNGYVIDLRQFDNIDLDVANQTVVIGVGSRLGTVISTLAAENFAIPTGECSNVGIAGLALGGGIGFLAHQHGLTCDAIISMRVLLADGSVVDVNQNSYPDLFWALRGAGNGSYGIVINFTFKMFYVPVVSYITLRWEWDQKCKIPAIYDAWQQWVLAQDADITSEFIFKYENFKSFIAVSALKVGDAQFDEWKKYFEKFKPIIINDYHGDYLGAAKRFASNYIFPFSKVKSKFNFRPLSESAVNLFINFYNNLQNNGCEYTVLTEFDPVFGGAISQGDTAYFPRKAFSSTFTFIYWPRQEQTQAALTLLNEFYAAFEPFTSQFSYANLVDYDLGPTYLNAYYGNHVARLIEIKNKYDPENIFNWKQSIPTKLIKQSSLSYLILQKYCGC